MRIVIRVTDEELTREFPQAFFAVLKPISPGRVELSVAAVTGPRRVAGNRVCQIRRHSNVFRQLPGHAWAQTVSAIDAARLFISRTLTAEIQVEIQFRGGGDTDSARMDQHALVGALASFLLIVLKRVVEVVAPGEFLDLPIGAEGLIGAEQIRHRAGIEFEAAIDRNRRSKLMQPIKTVTQPRQPA